jgi:formate hydrogenlyase subunit 3/multisubunit Na+/H+ antiporter MnhD subunit
MIAGGKHGRWRSRLIHVLWILGSLAAIHLIWYLTGFGDWLERTPVAIGAVRAFGVVLFLFCAAAIVFFREEDEGPRKIREWFYAAFAVLLAAVHGALLIFGEDALGIRAE